MDESTFADCIESNPQLRVPHRPRTPPWVKDEDRSLRLNDQKSQVTRRRRSSTIRFASAFVTRPYRATASVSRPAWANTDFRKGYWAKERPRKVGLISPPPVLGSVRAMTSALSFTSFPRSHDESGLVPSFSLVPRS